MNFSVCLPKVPIEGSVSQIFNIGPSYNFMSKIGELFVILFQNPIFSISTFHKMRTKTYKKKIETCFPPLGSHECTFKI